MKSAHFSRDEYAAVSVEIADIPDVRQRHGRRCVMAATPQRQDSSWGTASHADFGDRERSENGRLGSSATATGLGAGEIAQLAKALGWFSLGLGFAQLAAPRQVANVIGLAGDDTQQTVMRLLGVREIVSGLGILAQAEPTPWLWSRVGGDAMDLVLLRLAMDSPPARKDRVTAATLAVVGITAADLLCSTKLTGASNAPDEGMAGNDVSAEELRGGRRS
jgi:hypothetical protein